MDNSAAGTKKVPIPRPRKACTICRGLKTRCLPDSENSDPTAPCSRCARLGLQCDYSRARKGRGSTGAGAGAIRGIEGGSNSNNVNARHNNRPRPYDRWDNPRMASGVDSRELAPVQGLMNGVGMVGGVSPVGMGITTLPSMGHMPQIQFMRGWNASQPSMTSRSPLGDKPVTNILPRPVAPNSAPDYPSTLTNGHHSNTIYARSTHSVDSPNGRSRPIAPAATLANFFDSILGFEDNRASPVGSQRSQVYYATPADSGIIAEHDARYLYDQFVQYMSPPLGLFDHRYHTYERLLGLPLLLAAILSAAARFFRADVYSQINHLAEQNINHAVANGDHDLQLVQALIVLIVWLKGSDHSAYAKLGIMSRILNELRVSFAVQSSAQASNEDDERRTVDVDRTIFVAKGLDLVYSRLLHLPPSSSSSLPDPQQVEVWAAAHRHLDVPSDSHKAFLARLWDCDSQFSVNPQKLTEWTWAESEKNLIDILNKWINHASMSGTIFAPFTVIIGKTTLLNLRLLGLQWRVATTLSPNDLMSVADEIGLAIQEVIGRAEVVYLSELHCAMLVLPALLLYNARSLFGAAELSRASDFCRDVYTALEGVSAGPAELPIAKARHCYRRLLGALDLLLRPAPTPKTACSSHSVLPGPTAPSITGTGPELLGQQQHPQASAWGNGVSEWFHHWQGIPTLASTDHQDMGGRLPP